MQVCMLFYETEADFAARTAGGEAGEAFWGAWRAFVGAMNEAGIVRGGQALQPPAGAVVVRRGGAAPQVLDGPYAETKEQLGGTIVIEVPDMDAAIAWAARCPAVARGAVELRPVLPMG